MSVFPVFLPNCDKILLSAGSTINATNKEKNWHKNNKHLVGNQAKKALTTGLIHWWLICIFGMQALWLSLDDLPLCL